MNQNSTVASRDGAEQWLVRCVVLLVAFVVVGLFLYFFVTIYGTVSGEEFSPVTFSRRSFYYTEVPLIQVQITSISRKDETGDLEAYLKRKKLFPLDPAAKNRWDLVATWRAEAETFRGDASILCTYLDAEDEESDLYWLSWTKEHPKLAQVFWPTVAELANQQLYFFLPELFQIARAADGADQLKQDLDQTLLLNYLALVQTQQQLNDHESATMLIEDALRRFPENVELQTAFEASKTLTKNSLSEP